MMNMKGENRLNRAFTGIPTFLKSNNAPRLKQLNAKMAVFGVPFDEGLRICPVSMLRWSDHHPGTHFAATGRQRISPLLIAG
ncbi:hypothetical protein [Celerinatantimonas sp. YJH-8]|uniref:hypothetical protein n=1 Tax=Celerinatantimonas sp. YJH-8 TaxID=3228714 RepID=UPI0038C25A2E